MDYALKYIEDIKNEVNHLKRKNSYRELTPEKKI